MPLRNYSVSQRNLPKVFWHFSQTGRNFFDQILHACYTFPLTLDDKFSFNFLQLWRSYVILSATTQFTSYTQNVHHRPKCTLAFGGISPKHFGLFSPNFTHLLHVSIYVRLQFLFNHLQLWRSYAILSATTQPAFRPTVDILRVWWWVVALNMA